MCFGWIPVLAETTERRGCADNRISLPGNFPYSSNRQVRGGPAYPEKSRQSCSGIEGITFPTIGSLGAIA